MTFPVDVKMHQTVTHIYRFDLALLSVSVAASAFYYVPLNLIKKQQEPLKHVIAPHEVQISLKP